MQQSGTQEGQARVRDATAQPRLRGATSLECVDQPERKLVAIFGAAVGQSWLGQVPDLLVGIEFGAVGWEIFEPEPWNPITEVGGLSPPSRCPCWTYKHQGRRPCGHRPHGARWYLERLRLCGRSPPAAPSDRASRRTRAPRPRRAS